MRLKNVPGSRDEIAASSYAVIAPQLYRSRWHTLYPGKQPLHLEIGMGKGRFLLDMAALHPEINYLGIEKYSSVLVKAVRKQEEMALPNLMFARMDAEEICDCLAEGEAAKIYLNFSDPWPKDRHAKRRLTSDRFLERYDRILPEGGILEFKTDNEDLFAFSLESIRNHGWEIVAEKWDLHHSSLCEGNVMTEYEEKFSAQGHPICKLIARRRSARAII